MGYVIARRETRSKSFEKIANFHLFRYGLIDVVPPEVDAN